MKRLIVPVLFSIWLSGCAGTATYIAADFGYPGPGPYATVSPFDDPYHPWLFRPHPSYRHPPGWIGPPYYRHRLFPPPEQLRLPPLMPQSQPPWRYYHDRRHFSPWHRDRSRLLPHERRFTFDPPNARRPLPGESDGLW
jgi:uncharacterized protein YceK